MYVPRSTGLLCVVSNQRPAYFWDTILGGCGNILLDAEFGKGPTSVGPQVAEIVPRFSACRELFTSRTSSSKLLTAEACTDFAMEAPGGVEPPTNGLGNRCSIQLSYGANAS